MNKEIIEGMLMNTKSKLVYYDGNTNNGVEFNDSKDKNYFSTIETVDNKEYSFYYVFKRNNRHGANGNCLAHALKGDDKGWKFADEQEKLKFGEEIEKSLQSFCNDIKFNTIWVVQSSSDLNRLIAHYLKDLRPEVQLCEDNLIKYELLTAYQFALDQLNTNIQTIGDPYIRKFVHDKSVEGLQDSFRTMQLHGRKTVSLKYLPFDQRALFTKLFGINGNFSELEKATNKKDILIVDDLSASGETIKNAISTIERNFYPESISILTMFSKQENEI